MTNLQHSRRETVDLNPVPGDITEDVLKENISKALSLAGVNVVHNNLHACHQMKRLDRVIVKFKCCSQKESIMYKCKNLGNKSQELVRVCLIKTNSLHTNADNLKVPGRFTLPGSLTML